MATQLSNANEKPIDAKVSVFARLVPALSFMLAAVGAAVGSLYVRDTLWAMRNVETAGVVPVAGGLAEANLFVLIALYLAIVCGFAGILVFVVRLFIATKTISPSTWFFIGAGAAGLLPVLLVWIAESILIRAVAGHSGIVQAASTINWLSILGMIAAPFSILVLLAGSVWPLSSQSKRRWGPLLALVAIEVLLIVVAVAFQVRTSWLLNARILEHM